jgi:hypothetical protein
MSTANRGKTSEKAVAKYLTEMGANNATFDWHRQYDAKSAGGKFPAQPGDYAFYSLINHGLIEVKEVDHDFRLPKKNFENDKIARLYKRQLAGGKICVVISFTTTKKWRNVPFEYFRERLVQPSWDLSEFPTYDSATEALDAYFGKGTRNAK